MKSDIRLAAVAWAAMFFTSSASAQFNLLPPQKTFEEEQTQAAAQHDKGWGSRGWGVAGSDLNGTNRL